MTISIQYINTGTSANKGNGDTLRQAFMKINTNFATVSSSTLFDGNYSNLIGIPQDISVAASPTFSDLTLNGLNLTLANTSTSAAGANGAGIYVVGPATTASILYASSNDSWNINKTLNVTALLINGQAVSPTGLGDITITDNIIGTVNTDENLVLNPNGNGRVNLASSALQFDNGNDNIYRGHLLYTAPNSGLVGLGIDDNNASLRIVGDAVTTGTLVDFGRYDNVGGTWTSKVYIDSEGVMYLGNQYPITKYPYSALRSTGDSPVYFATLIGQNINTGTTASTDFVMYNDQGTDLTNFLDIGINSSNYDAPEFSVNGAGDSYIFAANNNLTIGTAAPNSALVFHAGGTTTNDAGGRLDQYGWTLNRRVEVIVPTPSPLRFKVQNGLNNSAAQAVFEAVNDVDTAVHFGINSSNAGAVYGNIGPGEAFFHIHNNTTATTHLGGYGNLVFYSNQTDGFYGTATLVMSQFDRSSTFAGNILPAADLTYDLGSTSSQWRSLYVGTSTIYLGGTALSVEGGNLSVNGNPVQSSSTAPWQITSSTAVVSIDSTGVTTFPNGHTISTGEGDMVMQSQGGVSLRRLNTNNDGTSYMYVSHDTIALYPRSEDLQTQAGWAFDANGGMTFPDYTVQTTAYPGRLLSTVAKTTATTGAVLTVIATPTTDPLWPDGTYMVDFGGDGTIQVVIALNTVVSADLVAISASNTWSVGDTVGTISGNDLLGGGPDLVLTVGTITPNRVALDLTNAVNKLSDGAYTLADGQEGQVMHLVRRDAATSDQVTLTVAHGRVNGVVYPDILYTPFTFNSLPNDLITLIFTDGAWQSNNGAWD